MSRRIIPNSTQIPDVILDDWMPRLSCAEFKVVLFVARKTFGWGRQSEGLSSSFIGEGTGLSRRAVIDACHHLERRAMLVCQASDLPHGHPKAKNTYRLNLDWRADLATSEADTGPCSEHGEVAAHDGAEGEGEDPTLPDITGADFAPVQTLHQCKNVTSTGAEFAPAHEGRLVQNLHPIRNKETTLETHCPPSPQGGEVASSKSRKPRRKSATSSASLSPEQQRLFDSWWEAYPNKVGKDRARESWAKLAPDAELIAAMRDGMRRWKASGQWTRGAFQNPATWLNQSCWKDYPAPATLPAGTNGQSAAPSRSSAPPPVTFDPDLDKLLDRPPVPLPPDAAADAPAGKAERSLNPAPAARETLKRGTLT